MGQQNLVWDDWIATDGCGEMPLTLINNMETLVPIGVNSFPRVSFPPVGGLFMLVVNGTTFSPPDGSFSLSGQNITWTSTILSVYPTDTVVAIYSYMG